MTTAISRLDSLTVTTRRIPRRIGAVLAGLAANAVPASAVDGVLHATGVFPPAGERMADVRFVLAWRIAWRSAWRGAT